MPIQEKLFSNNVALQELEQWLWDAACSIRGSVDAPKFKDYILPLLFFKRLSDVFEDELEKLKAEFEDEKFVKEQRKYKFSNDNNYSFSIKVSSRQDIIRDQQEGIPYEGGNFDPLVNLGLWEKDKTAISSQKEGEIKCPKFANSLLSELGKACKIIKIGNNKMLLRYYQGWPIAAEEVEKEYVLYTADKRWDIFVHLKSIHTSEVAEFQRLEKGDFSSYILDKILETIE